MKVDHCIILAAGLGTRMGKIGEHLPKILWPVFEKSLLQLQINFAERLGIKNIFINTHYQKDFIREYLFNQKMTDKITVLEEEKLLGVGGAIHNLAAHEKVNYSGNLLILNCDQFIFFSVPFIEKALNLLKNHPAVLFSTTLDYDPTYSEIILNENKEMIGISRPPKIKDQFTTYSGTSLIKLDALTPVKGVSDFFTTVANFNTSSIATLATSGLKYWDFGTTPRYAESCFQVLDILINKPDSDLFIDFLIECGAIEKTKINSTLNSYGCNNSKSILNFSQFNINSRSKHPSIILDTTHDMNIDHGGIYWRDLVQNF